VNGPAADVTYDTVVHLRPMAQQASELLTVMSTAYPFCSGRFARGPLHGRVHGESSRVAEVLGPFSRWLRLSARHEAGAGQESRGRELLVESTTAASWRFGPTGAG